MGPVVVAAVVWRLLLGVLHPCCWVASARPYFVSCQPFQSPTLLPTHPLQSAMGWSCE